MRRRRGFTLLEVVIAMAIAAIALTALFGAASATSRNAAAMRAKTYGQLVASNQLAEMRARRAWPAVGTQQGSSELAGRRWQWRATVADTDDDAIRRIDFSVMDADGGTVATMSGFLGRPAGG